MTAGYGGFLYSPDPKDIPEHWHWLIGPTEGGDGDETTTEAEDRGQSEMHDHD